MEIRRISPGYAVSPQLMPEDMAILADKGFTAVVCNRPDTEVPPELQAAALRAAAESAGLRFVANPIAGGALTLQTVETQRRAQDESSGPVLAYCASGTRSAVAWAFSQSGLQDTAQILRATANAGYPLDGLAAQIDALAARG